MKKRYVISIIIVFIFLLSFFAYNKLSHKEVSEYSNTIGIYLEDDYESNTYTLSDSSDIPDNDYVFNAEKTNEECPNATFSYDSESNKVQVNSNKSVECNMYFKADVPQLVHYTMLYDGSLGDAETNQMKSITGGWVTDTYTNPSFNSGYAVKSNIQFTDSYFYSSYSWTGSSNTNGVVRALGFTTNNSIDYTNYPLIMLLMDMSSSLYRQSGSSYCTASIYMNVCPTKDGHCGNANYLDSYLNINSGVCGSQAAIQANNFNKKYIFINPTNNIGYLTFQTYDPAGVNGSGGVTKSFSFKTYYAVALKGDNYSELASKLNVTVSSIDDLLNNYSSQILNNEKTVKYMIKQCTGDFMASAINNSTFMTAYESSPYKSLIDANEHWHKFITMIQS